MAGLVGPARLLRAAEAEDELHFADLAADLIGDRGGGKAGVGQGVNPLEARIAGYLQRQRPPRGGFGFGRRGALRWRSFRRHERTDWLRRLQPLSS